MNLRIPHKNWKEKKECVYKFLHMRKSIGMEKENQSKRFYGVLDEAIISVWNIL